MTDDLPPHVNRVRLRMYHSDLLTPVFHGRIFEIFEDARTEAFRRLGFEYRAIEEAGQAMIVTAIGARFFAAGRFDEVVRVGVFVDALSKARITIGYEGRRERDATLLFTGETAFAFVDLARGRPVRVPEGIRAVVQRYPAMLRRPQPDGWAAPPATASASP